MAQGVPEAAVRAQPRQASPGARMGDDIADRARGQGTMRGQILELDIPVDMLIALERFGVGLQTVTTLGQKPTDHEIADPVTAVPRKPRVNARIDFDVHRSRDIGSPRVTGSINKSNAAASSPA